MSFRFSKVTSANEDHQLPSVGGLMMSIPWILHYAEKSEEECASLAVEAMKLTHPAPSLFPYVEVYAKMLRAVIHGADLEVNMVTSWHVNAFRITGPLWTQSSGHQWWRALMFSLLLAWKRCLTNSRIAGDLRRHDAHNMLPLLFFSRK